MPSEVDRQIERATALLTRASTRFSRSGRRRLARRLRDFRNRLKRLFLAVMVVLVGAAGVSFFHPLGMTGLLAVIGLLIGCLILLFIPTIAQVEEGRLGQAPLMRLPQQTQFWLEDQCAALPPAALPLVDAIGHRLESLTPQLQRLDPGEPAAMEIRKLLSDHLPELVSGYRSIPADLRRVERNGRVPDAQLVEGLAVIEREIGEMTQELARGDLDKLATHSRYLELKYQEAKQLGRE